MKGNTKLEVVVYGCMGWDIWMQVKKEEMGRCDYLNIYDEWGWDGI